MFFVFLVNAMGLLIIVVSTLLERLRARLVKHGQCFPGHEFTEGYQAPPLRPTRVTIGGVLSLPSGTTRKFE